MTPAGLTFPGLDGPVTASVEQQADARHAVIVVADLDDGGAAEEQRGALVEAGFIVAWLPSGRVDDSGLPHVEDLAGLLGTLFVTSHATVGVVARGRSCPVALATVEGAHELVAAAVLIGAADEVGDASHEALVPIVRLDAAATPAAVVQALTQQFDPGAADVKSRRG